MVTSPIDSINADQAVLENKKLALISAARRGTDWFFWIAGLSIINSILYLTGSSISFIFGLEITQFIDAFTKIVTDEVSADGSFIVSLIGIFLDIVIAAIFIGAGFLSRKRIKWVVIAGMAIYAVDTVICLFFSDWMPALFHAWVLFSLGRGLKALYDLQKLDQANLTFNQAAANVDPMRQSLFK